MKSLDTWDLVNKKIIRTRDVFLKDQLFDYGDNIDKPKIFVYIP